MRTILLLYEKCPLGQKGLTETVVVGDSTAKKQRGRPFPKGRSGNPSGRPIGARNRATIVAEALMDADAPEIARVAIKKAKSGDPVCIRICMDRIIPPRRDRAVQFDLPNFETAADAVGGMAHILEAVARGEITPSEGETISRLVTAWIQSLQVADFEQRLAKLESEI